MIPKEYFGKLDSSAKTINRKLLEKGTDNIYKSIAIVAKRSKQINTELREELHEKLEEFSVPRDVLDEVFENREQIEVSKYYESLPKAHTLAVKEWIDQKTYFRNTSEETEI